MPSPPLSKMDPHAASYAPPFGVFRYAPPAPASSPEMARILELLERQERRLKALEDSDKASQPSSGASSGSGRFGTDRAFGDLFNLDRTLENLKKMVGSRDSQHGLVWELIRQRMNADPSNTCIIGNLHNTPDGTRTYFSFRVRYNDEQFAAVHAYGSLRGKCFWVKSLDIFHYSEKYENAAVFTVKEQTE